MAELGFWRDLEARFRGLEQSRGGELRANWISTAWNEAGDKWYLSGCQDERVHAMFKWAAERGALGLGHTGGTSDAVFFWLDLLKRDSPNFRGGISATSRARRGTKIQHEGGTVYRVCQASADYCLKLENEHGEPTSSVGQKWYNSNPDTVRRRQLVLKNPKMPSKSLRNVFDGATPPIPLPGDWWAEFNVNTWLGAYGKQTTRKRIQKIISTDRKAK